MMNIVYSLYLPGTIFCASLILMTHMEQNSFFPLRVVAGYVIMVSVYFLIECVPISNPIVSESAKFILQLILLVFLLRFSFRIPWSDCFFGATAGYTIQHIASLSGNLVATCFYSVFFEQALRRFLLRVTITAISYLAAYRFLGANLIPGQEMHRKKLPHLLFLMCVMLVEIVISSFIYSLEGDPLYWDSYRAALVSNTICSCALLSIQFTLLEKKTLESELWLANQLRQKEREQYLISKDTIDLINLKCHDMRHQIRAIGQNSQLKSQVVQEMENAISIYDTQLKTGNQALDIILAEKNLYCQKNGITINCIADGSALSFMSELDIYSLFGNLLDNAINAVLPLDITQRAVGLSIKRHNGFVSISSYNYYTGFVRIDQGLPVTTQSDSKNHGFGMKSMKMMVEKYGGSVTYSLEKDIFNLSILIPILDPGDSPPVRK